jgi:hypothetical protein
MTERNRLLLPVNWRNALAYYAQGLAVPSAVLTRHRQDLLELAPRRLPLVRGWISRSVAEVCGPMTGDFPVALEIDTDLSVRGEELDLDGTRVAVAPIGVIPTSHVSRIHVRSDRDRKEFLARRYRNIDTERLPVTVGQAVFNGEGVQAEPLSTWLLGLPNPNPFELRDLVELQCVAGALMLILAAIPYQTDVLEGAGRLFENVLGRPRTGEVLGVLSGTLADIGWSAQGDDLAICAAAIEILAEMSAPEPPVASEVLTKMRALLAGRDLSDAGFVSTHLDRILAIDRGDAAFTQFRHRGGLRAAKGLLLFLLRPDPTAVRTWLDENINAEAETIALAAVFSGVAYRSTGLPPELRGSDAVQHLLFDWIASGVNSPDVNIRHSIAPVVVPGRRGGDIVLTIDGRPT